MDKTKPVKPAGPWLSTTQNSVHRVKDMGLGSDPDSATYQLSSFCYLFALISLALKWAQNPLCNAVVRTQGVNAHGVLSAVTGASHILSY